MFSTVLGCALGVFFVASGARKLVGWEWALETYRAYHPDWVYHTSAVVEVVTGLALLVPRTRFAGALGQLALIAWVTFWPLRALDPRTAIPFAITTVLLVTVCVLTTPRCRRHAGCVLHPGERG